MEIGILVELRERAGRRDRFLFACATVPTLIILMTTVSCSTPGPEMPQRRTGIVERAQPKPTATPKARDGQRAEGEKGEHATAARCSKKAAALPGFSGMAEA
jgi:hypothetical protein